MVLTSDMEYRRLGKSGLKLSALSFGSWVTFGGQVNLSLAQKLMHFAYDHGVNFFDNAEVYAQGESEKIMGQVLKNSNWSRDSFCVSSKVFWGGDKPTQTGLSRKHIWDACNQALKRLQVDYLDLFFCHRPDPETPLEETVSAMSDLVRQGKVLYWGTSEWKQDQISQAFQLAKGSYLIAPTMEQPEYNLFQRANLEKNLKPLCQNLGLGTTIWSPLASGILTGKYNQGIPKGTRMAQKGFEWLKNNLLDSPEGIKKLKKIDALTKIAHEIPCTLAQLSIAWCLKNSDVSTVILGASNQEQLEENLKAFQFVPILDSKKLSQIDKIVEDL